MLANFVIWILILFLLYTFGDILIVFYNKICKRNETYNLTDKVLIGLGSLAIPLSIWSLYLASNQNFLLIISTISIIYWGINHKRFIEEIKKAKGVLSEQFSTSQILLFASFIFTCLFFFSWQQDVYDSAFYHLQNIRWNEEYAVVPGLGNLDDRFAFNSNYFLLSAIFTFRFIFGVALYPLQPFIVMLIGLWTIYELFRSRYELKRLILLFSYILFFGVSIYFMGNTSTDIFPNMIVFYLIARYIFYPELLRSNYLIGIIIPVFLLTCKLSLFPIGLISLYLVYYLFREKRYSVIFFVCITALFILIPWLVRNVVISGYLIYPLYQLDFFSFDWKIPHEIAIKQKDYIFDIGYYFFRIAIRYPHDSIRDPLAINILTDIIYLLVLATLAYTSYKLFKERKSIDHSKFLLFVVFILSIIIWATGGPDIRFIPGIMCIIITFGGYLFFSKKDILLPSFSSKLLGLFILSLIVWTCIQLSNFHSSSESRGSNIASHILLRPYTTVDIHKAYKDKEHDILFEPYSIGNNLSIFVSSHLPSDLAFPATIHSHYSKFLPIECIESRGHSLQDGFKVKGDCNK
ncbi:MAG: hypothetical protein E6767_18695 [Dysgonomonas sp.]|nr:hypothetical protein [Dysgonomonas sp.]